MNFSHKLDAFEASIFTELLEAKLALRAKGVDTIDLSIGTPDLTPPAHVMRAISEACMEPKNYIYAVKDRPQLLETVIRAMWCWCPIRAIRSLPTVRG